MDTPDARSLPAPRVLNPLWIISLFLGLSETTVGVAATQAHGWIQGLFAIFAVTFPLLVSGVFFGIVGWKPEVLYAPGDFPEHVPVPAFVDGMHRGTASNLDTISTLITETLQSVLPSVLTPQVPASVVEQVVSEAVASAQSELDSRAIKVDLRQIALDLDEAELFFDPSLTVEVLLNFIWVELRGHVRPFAYPSEWILIDRQSLKIFNEMGSTWAWQHSTNRDKRSLADVGIHPGMQLAAVRTREKRPQQGWLQDTGSAATRLRDDVDVASRSRNAS